MLISSEKTKCCHSIGDFTYKRTVWDIDLGPLDGDDVIARPGDLIDDVIEIVSGVGDVGLVHAVWMRPVHSCRQASITCVTNSHL